MKKLLLFTLLASALMVKAQAPFSLVDGESVLVYSLPKTVFCVEIETEKISQKPGKFYRYSERYLATNKVITEEKTIYKIKNISVKTKAVADPGRTYFVTPSGNLQTSRLSVNADGLLRGVNLTPEPQTSFVKSIDTPKNENSVLDALLPLGEEYMMAGSEAKLAEGAAKQIYRIRESRMGLLTADVEKMPADGESLKAMLEGMNKLEKKLTELFVGETTTETQTKMLYLTPTTMINNDVLFRFSALKGVVAADDLSGVPYYISLVPVEKVLTSGSKSKSESGALYTVIPLATQFTLGDGVNTIFSNQFLVSQFGKTVSLPESLFKQANIKVRVDVQTGRLLGVE